MVERLATPSATLPRSRPLDAAAAARAEHRHVGRPGRHFLDERGGDVLRRRCSHDDARFRIDAFHAREVDPGSNQPLASGWLAS